MTEFIDQLTDRLASLTTQISYHPLYNEISSVPKLRLFMEQHVFAVWDFMCLLKELHSSIVSTAAPWVPPKDALSANLISSILVEEEGDLAEDGVHYASHYDIYLSAMAKIGADTTKIKKLQMFLNSGISLSNALDKLDVHLHTKNFVLTTFSFFKHKTPHELAAAFVYGREGITGAMFSPMIEQLKRSIPLGEQEQLSTVLYYFKRHVELDDNDHYPKAIKMLSNLIENDPKKLQEAENAAIKALNARLAFLTGIQGLISTCSTDKAKTAHHTEPLSAYA